jgi:hypothetical protein
MRNYQIYLIEEEFAHHYFGREKIFFNLFLEYTNSSGNLKGILQKQIEYITRPIPTTFIQQTLDRRLLIKQDTSYKDGVYFIEKKLRDSRAALQLNSKYLVLHSEGDLEAETTFFECIRKCESSFLAIDFTNKRCGWLKPIKERKFV